MKHHAERNFEEIKLQGQQPGDSAHFGIDMTSPEINKILLGAKQKESSDNSREAVYTVNGKTIKYTDIERDQNGRVTSFKDDKGRTWKETGKQGCWSETGGNYNRTMTLGEVRFLKDGVHADGPDVAVLGPGVKDDFKQKWLKDEVNSNSARACAAELLLGKPLHGLYNEVGEIDFKALTKDGQHIDKQKLKEYIAKLDGKLDEDGLLKFGLQQILEHFGEIAKGNQEGISKADLERYAKENAEKSIIALASKPKLDKADLLNALIMLNMLFDKSAPPAQFLNDINSLLKIKHLSVEIGSVYSPDENATIGNKYRKFVVVDDRTQNRRAVELIGD